MEPTDRTPAQVHAAEVRRQISRLPRWGWGDRQSVIATCIELGNIYANQHSAAVARLTVRATRAQGTDEAMADVLRRQLADAQAERDEALRKLTGLGAAEAQLLSENEELNRQLAALRDERSEQDRALMSVIAQRDAAEKRIEELSAQFPACPACGCRTPGDPDRTECGCDEGCNDGDQAPGVNVLLRQRDTAEQRLADVVAEHAKRDAAHDQTLRRVAAERDRLAAERAPASNCASHGMDERCFDCATDAELAAAIPPAPAPVTEPAPARATRARGSRAKAGAGQDMPGRSESLTAPSLGTKESGFAE